MINKRRVTRGGKGVRSPLPFPKLEKSAPILGKNGQFVVIYGLHFSCGFKSFQKKKPKILLCRTFLSCVVDKMLIEVT